MICGTLKSINIAKIVSISLESTSSTMASNRTIACPPKKDAHDVSGRGARP
jgi:hypothetical protein